MSSLAAAKARSDEIDALVVDLLKKTGATRKGVAVVATGGYGRAALSPGSDIDLLFVIATTDDAQVRALTDGVLYPLWDAKLTVGHAVRTVAECIEIGRADMTVRSAMLDHRYVAGDRGVYKTFGNALEKKLFATNKVGFVRFKLEEIARRRERAGDAVYRNEPDLKEGEGGLRDAQTALWIGRTVWDASTPSALARERLVTAAQVKEWNAAAEHLHAVRGFLHTKAGRKDDRLSFERQTEAAAFFGHTDDDRGVAAEHFMRRLLIHQAAVQRFLADVVDQLPRRYREASERSKPRRRPRRLPDRFTLDNGRLTFRSFRRLGQRARDLVRIFGVSAELGIRIHPKARQAIRTHLDAIDGDVQRDPEASQAFLGLFTSLENGAEGLANMNALGVLGRYVPEFEANFCRMQYDKYHVFTVDAHSIQAVKEAQRVFAGYYADSQPMLTEVAQAMDARPTIFGTFLHDVGKGAGSGHVAAGAKMVPVICARLGIGDTDEARLVLFLELEHLLMSHVAQRRDLADPKTIADFADKVGTVERLRALYVMTFADIRAVGPSTWSGWKGQLLEELYLRTLAHMAGKVDADSTARHAQATRIRAAARKRLSERIPGEIADAFLDRFYTRYYMTHDAPTIVSDFTLVHGAFDTVRMQARVRPERELLELCFYTPDRPGLFADLTGVLAAANLSIRSARIHTTVDGYALDRFEVTGTDLPHLARVERNAREVLSGARTSAELVEGSRSRWRESGAGPTRRPTRIEVHHDASDYFTVIDLVATDRLGLLADVTRALAANGVDIALAIVSTKVDQVSDTFYVRRVGGGKLGVPAGEVVRDALQKAVDGGS